MVRAGRAVLFLAVLACALLLVPAGVRADSLAAAVKDYDALRNDHAAAAHQPSWQAVAGRFERLYKADPDGKSAAEVLYYLARIKEESARRFHARNDYFQAADYFERISKRFPGDKLADDGLYRAANICYSRLDDTERAKADLHRVVIEYPSGNYAKLAKESLARLDKAESEAEPRPAEVKAKPTPLPKAPVPAPGRDAKAESKSESKSAPKSEAKPELKPEPKPLGAPLLTPAKAGQAVPKGRTELQAIRYRTSPEYTRIVLDVAKPAKYAHFVLDRPEVAGDTARHVVVDLDGVSPGPKVEAEMLLNKGILKRIRAGSSGGKARVVVDVDSFDHANVFALLDPFRVVVDIFGPERNGKSDSAQAPAPAAQGKEADSGKSGHDDKLQKTLRELRESVDKDKSTTEAKKTPAPAPALTLAKPGQSKPVEEPPVAAPAAPAVPPVPQDAPEPATDRRSKQAAMDIVSQLGLKIRTVMIDAGHGGHDPGAMHYGLQEKDIALAMALSLGQALREKGITVLYTRATDVFIPLEDRTAMANEKKADMFISLHCNASPNEAASGLEVYYLNSSKSRDALRVASRENAISTKRVSDLQYILTELMLNYKIKESSTLARQVRSDVLKSVRTRYDLKDNGVREAPFYVLMGAKMPAILVEMGYITNREESQRLMNQTYRDLLVDGILEGVFGYKRQAETLADAKKGG